MQTLFHHGYATASTSSCPRCGTRLPAQDINVATDAALCRQCGATYRFSELIYSGGFLEFDLCNPPAGARFLVRQGGFAATASTRSAQAWFLVPFLCVWSGFSLGGIYGSQLLSGEFNLFQTLFGIPFILGTLLLGSKAVMSAGGRVLVERDAENGCVFEGVWRIGWTRRFRWSDVASVTEAYSDAACGNRSGPPDRLISINFKLGMRPSIKFGVMLPAELRGFLIAAVRSQLAKS